MKTLRLELGPFDINTYIIISDDGLNAIVVDPAVESGSLLEMIKELNVIYIINTHGHFDHIGGNNSIKYAKGSQIVVHKNDAKMLTDANLNLSAHFINPLISSPADIEIPDESYILKFSEVAFSIIEVPGHSDGSIALYNQEKGMLFSGDLIFENSIGRTDFPGGSSQKIKKSIEKIMTLPDTTRVFPGHEDEFYLGDFKPKYQQILESELI